MPHDTRQPAAHHHRPPPRPAAGFTLMELLVVVAIMVILVSLALVGAGHIRTSGRESQTRSMLGGLTGIAAQYEASTQMEIAHLNSQIYQWNENKRRNAPNTTGTAEILGTPLAPDDQATFTGTEAARHEMANLFSERFVWAALQIPDLATRLRGLGPNTLVDLDNDGFLELRDPWGHSIAYATRTVHNSTATSDDDFLPVHGNPFFASAGADGLWGQSRVRGEFANEADYNTYLSSPDGRDSRDNLYSFDIDRGAAEVGN